MCFTFLVEWGWKGRAALLFLLNGSCGFSLSLLLLALAITLLTVCIGFCQSCLHQRAANQPKSIYTSAKCLCCPQCHTRVSFCEGEGKKEEKTDLHFTKVSLLLLHSLSWTLCRFDLLNVFCCCCCFLWKCEHIVWFIIVKVTAVLGRNECHHSAKSNIVQRTTGFKVISEIIGLKSVPAIVCLQLGSNERLAVLIQAV